MNIMSNMNYETVLNIVVLFLLFVVLYLIKRISLDYKEYSTDEISSNYLITHGVSPCGFTFGYDKIKKLYKIYESSNKQISMKDKPIMPNNCNVYVPSTKEITDEDENGYAISCVPNIKFSCPKNFTWDTVSKTCKELPLCTQNDNGYAKGIDQYRFYMIENIVPYSKTSKYSNKIHHGTFSEKDIETEFHPRLYAICNEDPSDYTMQTCEDNYIFNQVKSQLFDPNNPPCELYDICNDMADGSRHNMQVPGKSKIENNQYYECQAGVSYLFQCSNNETFNAYYKTCMKNDFCVDKNDNFTYYISEKTYGICLNAITQLIECKYDVIFNKTKNIYECISIDCVNMPQYEYFINNNVKVPIIVRYCIDNTAHFYRVAYDIVSFKYNKIDNTNYPKPLDAMLTFDCPNKYLVFKSGEVTELPITEDNFIDFKVNDIYSMRYCNGCTIFNWNVTTDKMVTNKKYYNRLSDIINSKTGEKVNLKMIRCLGFVSTDQIYCCLKDKNVNKSSSLCDSLVYNYYFFDVNSEVDENNRSRIFSQITKQHVWIGTCLYYDDSFDVIRIVTVLSVKGKLNFYCIDIDIVKMVLYRNSYIINSSNTFDQITSTSFPECEYGDNEKNMKTHNTVLSVTNIDVYGNILEDSVNYSCFRFLDFNIAKSQKNTMKLVKAEEVSDDVDFETQLNTFLQTIKTLPKTVTFDSSILDYSVQEFQMLFSKWEDIVKLYKFTQITDFKGQDGYNLIHKISNGL